MNGAAAAAGFNVCEDGDGFLGATVVWNRLKLHSLHSQSALDPSIVINLDLTSLPLTIQFRS